MSRLTKPFRRGALCGLTLALALPVAAHASVLTQGAEAGLVARYALDQTSGTVVRDDSGNGRDATLQGGATWRGTEGLQLGGANGYVDLPDNLLRDLSAITVSIQVRIDADQATPVLHLGPRQHDQQRGQRLHLHHRQRVSLVDRDRQLQHRADRHAPAAT